jgi:hypothetical protein
MTSNQKIAALKQVSFSKFIQDDDLWYLLYACESVSLPEGAVLFAEKSFKESMYIVLDGKLEVYKKIINTLPSWGSVIFLVRCHC